MNWQRVAATTFRLAGLDDQRGRVRREVEIRFGEARQFAGAESREGATQRQQLALRAGESAERLAVATRPAFSSRPKSASDKLRRERRMSSSPFSLDR